MKIQYVWGCWIIILFRSHYLKWLKYTVENIKTMYNKGIPLKYNLLLNRLTRTRIYWVITVNSSLICTNSCTTCIQCVKYNKNLINNFQVHAIRPKKPLRNIRNTAGTPSNWVHITTVHLRFSILKKRQNWTIIFPAFICDFFFFH